MRIPTIYLETTIFNFPFAADAPQYRADVLRLFAEIKEGMFRPFTSEYVTREIVKHKTIIETEIINAREGFKRVFIHTPAEVIDHE